MATNNSTHSPQQIARRLARHGFQIPAERVVTAGFALVDHLAATSPAVRILPILPPVLRRYGEERGLAFVSAPEADVVALGRATSFCYRDLSAGANALARGARLVVSNLDLTHPGERGLLVPETGTVAAALRAAAEDALSRPLHVEVVGKPSPALAHVALARLGRDPGGRVVVLGDNPSTDGALAAAIGATFVQVPR